MIKKFISFLKKLEMTQFVSYKDINTTDIVRNIVNFIRNKIVMDNEIQDEDGWDENDGGVAWISNEIEFIEEYLDYEISNIGDFNNVEECINYLSNKDFKYLNDIYNCIINGGTDNEEYWKVVNMKRNEEKGIF
jgi:uncharacterized protein YlxP (DUF503 family)